MSKNKTIITLGKDSDSTEVSTRKSHLAKRIIIRFSEKNGFELIVPKRVSMKQAVDFLYKKEEWVLEKNRELQQKSRTIFENGRQITILGNIYTIKHSGSLRGVTKVEETNLLVSGIEEHISRKVRQFLINLAKSEISANTTIYSKNLNVKFSRITVRDTTTRWGSCSRSGNLSFSWRLVMAPREVLEYVVAHEVSHLKEMNHSKKFWDVVESIYPNYQQSKNWLKKHGHILHSYGE
jgi:predicted metal-dependent hydrolase